MLDAKIINTLLQNDVFILNMLNNFAKKLWNDIEILEDQIVNNWRTAWPT